MANKEIRVLVFGTTGTGKTSICNALTSDNRPTGNQAMGVTFKYFNCSPFLLDDKTCILTDTIGLNEAQKGTVNSGLALKSLIELLKNSREGYSLLIQVIRMGRVTKEVEDNYDFFVKKICDGLIPTILIATGCENEEPMSNWADINKSDIKSLGLDYKKILATCFWETKIDDFKKRFDEKRLESIELLKDSIITYSAMNPIKIYESQIGFLGILKKSWNSFCDYLGIGQWRFTINAKIKELLIRIGLSSKDADEIASNWEEK